MPKFGIHPFSWVSRWDETTLDLIDKIKNFGFDLVEVPMFETNTSLAKIIRGRLHALEMSCIGSVALSENTSVTSSDEKIRQAGIEFLKKCVIATAEMGGKILTGVTYAEFGKNPVRAATNEEWKYSAEALREVSRFARDYGITLGIEPINRYETNLINTANQAKKLKDMIGEDNVGIHLDTYHMNIEEKGFYQPVKEVGEDLIYIHMSESDRGILGTGNVDWDETFRALSEIDYPGTLTTETFCSPIPGIVAASVWRKLVPGEDIFAKKALKFLKKKAEEYRMC